MPVNQDGLVVAWAATANVCDNKFQPPIKEFADEMIVLSDEVLYQFNLISAYQCRSPHEVRALRDYALTSCGLLH